MNQDNQYPAFQPGDNMYLVDEKERYGMIVVPEAGESVGFKGDKFTSEQLCALHEGELLRTKNHRYLAMRPTLEQAIMNMPRQAQVIYPKDLGMLLVWGDVAPGMKVVEVGIGHGALTMTLLRALGPDGRLASYEIRQDHINRTSKNIVQFLGQNALKNWEPLLADPMEGGLEHKSWDRLFTDIPEPWEMLPAAKEALRPGGVWVAWLPTVLQMVNLVEAVSGDPYFCLPVCYETMQRFWHIRRPSVRPAHDMKAHTGFVVACRRRWRGNWQEEPTS